MIEHDMSKVKHMNGIQTVVKLSLLDRSLYCSVINKYKTQCFHLTWPSHIITSRYFKFDGLGHVFRLECLNLFTPIQLLPDDMMLQDTMIILNTAAQNVTLRTEYGPWYGNNATS